jgi:hypothetical protein
MSFQGMDTDQVLGQSEALADAARRLEGVLGDLHGSVHSAGWIGPDADAFRARWDRTRQQGDSLVLPGLEERSRELEQHVEDGGWLEDAWDWLVETGGKIIDGAGEVAEWIGDRFSDGADWIGDRISDGIDWIGDRASELGEWVTGTVSGGLDWLGDRVSSGLDWLGDRVQDGRDLVGTAVDAVRDLEWPRVTELLVDGASGLMRGANGLVETLTGIDLKLADDGTGYADAPVAVTGEESGLVPPSDLSQIIANTNATYGDKETGEVSMSVVGNPPTGVIVNIPGTEQWGPRAGDNPMDLTGNAAQAGSDGWSAGSEATADAIAQLYAENGIPAGTPLMLNGHSQGGMIASSLAANEDFASQYHLTNVMTYGSPVDNYQIPSGVNQLNLQHGGDAVPRIDLGGLALGPGGGGSDGATTITLDSPGSHPFDFGTNHSGGEYQNSVQTQLQDPDSALSRYSQDPSLAPFLTGEPGDVQHYTAGVHREN